MRRSQQNEGVCGSQLHRDLPTDRIIIFRVLFLPYQWPSFKDDALVVGLSHTREGTLGALPALAANAQLPRVCGASYNCALVAGRAWPVSFNVAVLSAQSCPGHGPLPFLGLLFGAALPPTNSAFGLAPHHCFLCPVTFAVPPWYPLSASLP